MVQQPYIQEWCTMSSFPSSCHGLGESMLVEIYTINTTTTVVLLRSI